LACPAFSPDHLYVQPQLLNYWRSEEESDVNDLCNQDWISLLPADI